MSVIEPSSQGNPKTSDTETRKTEVSPRPKRLLFVNGSAGRSESVPSCLAGFKQHDITEVDRLLPAAVANGDDENLLVAVWGGDGSIRSVAKYIVGTRAALLPAPGGTHNHFAKTCGIADADAISAAIDGTEVAVDVGMAGEELFLNNVSFGWYTDLVRRRETLEKSMPRKLAKACSVAVQISRTRRLQVRFDGHTERVWMVWIGNGEHALTPMRLADRLDTADGVLDVRLLRGGMRVPKLAALFTLFGHNRQSTDILIRSLRATVTLEFRRRPVHAAVDGELVTLPSPVTISCQSRVLIVRRPYQSPT